jgi:hypothetical protein
MTREDFLAYVEAFNRDDFAGYAKYYAPDVTISYRGGALTVRGAEAIVARYREIHKTIRQRIEPVYLVLGERAVAGEMHSSFTALEDAPDFIVHPLKKGQTVRIHTFVHYELNEAGLFTAIRSVRYRTLEAPG